MKARDVRGFMIEPKPFTGTKKYYDHGFYNGAKEAINLQGEQEITLNRENLALIIYGKTNYKIGYLLACAVLADAIIAALPELLESGNAQKTVEDLKNI